MGGSADGKAHEGSREDLQDFLDRFLIDARLRLALVVAGDGLILGRVGSARDVDLAACATLAANVHAASRALARMLGEPRFDRHHHAGGDRQLFIGTVAGPWQELVLVAVFGPESRLGLVRLRFEQARSELERWSHRAGSKTRSGPAGLHDAVLAAGLERARGVSYE